MVILEMLEAEHSKKQTTEIVSFIGSDQKRFDELFSLFMKAKPAIVQRAAWPLSYAVIANPYFINTHYHSLFKKLDDPSQHGAVQRHIMKIFSEIDNYPEKYHGLLIDHCLRFIKDPRAKTAVRAYSLRTLQKLCELYPDIIPEIKIIIEEGAGVAIAGYEAAVRNFLKKAAKIKTVNF